MTHDSECLVDDKLEMEERMKMESLVSILEWSKGLNPQFDLNWEVEEYGNGSQELEMGSSSLSSMQHLEIVWQILRYMKSSSRKKGCFIQSMDT